MLSVCVQNLRVFPYGIIEALSLGDSLSFIFGTRKKGYHLRESISQIAKMISGSAQNIVTLISIQIAFRFEMRHMPISF